MGLMDQFKQNYDPQMMGISLLSNVGNPNTGQSLGAALLAGRQARLAQAQRDADAAIAKKKMAIDMTKEGVYETSPGVYAKRGTINTATGAVLSQDISPTGEVNVKPVYTPPEKPQKTKYAPVGQPIPQPDGTFRQQVYNVEDPTDTQLVQVGAPPAKGGPAGAGRGSKSATAALEAAQAPPLAMTQFRDLITDPKRMSNLSGPINKAETAGAKLLNIPTPQTKDIGIWNRAASDSILSEVSKLAPATDTDVQLIKTLKLPNPGDRPAAIDYYNNIAAARRRILEKYSPEDLNNPEMQRALEPIPTEEAPSSHNTTSAGIKWRVK